MLTIAIANAEEGWKAMGSSQSLTTELKATLERLDSGRRWELRNGGMSPPDD